MPDTEHWTLSTLALLDTTPDAVVVVDLARHDRLREPAHGAVVRLRPPRTSWAGRWRPWFPRRRAGGTTGTASRTSPRRRRCARWARGPICSACTAAAASSPSTSRSARSSPTRGRLVIAAVRDMTERRHIERACGRPTRSSGGSSPTAAKIQESLLPASSGRHPRASTSSGSTSRARSSAATASTPSRSRPGGIGFYMLDVTGHGMVAALQSVALTRVLASTWTAQDLLLAGPAHQVAERGVPGGPGGLAVLHLPLRHARPVTTGRLRYASAGHPGPIHVPASRARRSRSRPPACRSAGSPTWSTTSSWWRSHARGPALRVLGRS